MASSVFWCLLGVWIGLNSFPVILGGARPGPSQFRRLPRTTDNNNIYIPCARTPGRTWCIILQFQKKIIFNPPTAVHDALSSKTLSRTKFVQQKRSSLIYFENWSFPYFPIFSYSIATDVNGLYLDHVHPCATSKGLTSMMSFCECCLQPIFGGAMGPL